MEDPKFTLENLKNVNAITFYPDKKQITFFTTIRSRRRSPYAMQMGQDRTWDKADCDARSFWLVRELIQVITGSKFEITRHEDSIEVWHKKEEVKEDAHVQSLQQRSRTSR